MSEVSDAARALGRGHSITLTNGETYRLIFTLGTLAVIEDELGSIDEMEKVLSGGGGKGQMKTIGLLLANSLALEDGTPVEIAPFDVLKRIEVKNLQVIASSLMDAFAEAMPDVPKVDTEAVKERIAAVTDLSSSPGAHFSMSGATSSTNPSQVFGV